ncbi:MAG: sigma-70 family RNA polymerase sigma factor [Bacteroidota bacterium]
MTDEQLMNEVQQGKLNTLSVLFERYKGQIYGFFFRLTYDQSLCDDLTQQVFERILRYRHSYNPTHSFRSWIFQIARNIRLDHLKRQKMPMKTTPNWDRIQGVEGNVSESIEKREQLEALEKALHLLTDDQREVLLLTRYQKLKYEEVGRLLGCSEGAVKVKVYRAIRQLRTIFFKLDKL